MSTADIENTENDSIEVTITFEDGHRRWTTFMTPEYLKKLLSNGSNSFHSNGIIFVNLLNPTAIADVIFELDRNNELFDFSREYC